MIARDMMAELVKWRNSDPHKPILLRGARQVGKSHLVREFGRSFEHFVEINFEKQTEPKEFFNGDLDVKKIIKKIELYTQKKIEPGKTLLFLDEIQECERAITALRYFKEEMQELHVIAAGSLVDFAFENISMPVGRITFLYLHPLSFAEYLAAIGREDLRTFILKNDVQSPFHEILIEHLRDYFWLGGMPEVIASWINEHSAERCQTIQDDLLQSYRQDFSKYAKRFKIQKLDQIFTGTPKQLGQKFTYKQLDDQMRSNVIKEGLNLLQKAGVIHLVYHSAGQGLPLMAGINEKRFKVYFLDIGLAQRLLGSTTHDLLTTKINIQHLGGLAEQFVAQDYIAHSDIHQAHKLFYWHREDRNSNAEVDFLFVKNSEIIPAEVKASAKGRLRSLLLFLETHPHSSYGIRVSELPASKEDNLETIPFYGIERWIEN